MPKRERDPFDIFLSYAGEDREALARPLARELRARGLSVWFDDFELSVGDSLRAKIDDGLRDAAVGVVLLSPAFFGKQWPQRELDALTSRETSGGAAVLPIWHNVNADAVRAYSPALADRLAVSSDAGVEAVADEIARTYLARFGLRSSPDRFVSSEAATQPGIRLFYSYSHRDERHRSQLETHLALLRRRGTIQEWHDRKIGAGDEWRRSIDVELSRADVILLLVSPDFLASDFAYIEEMERAMERHATGSVRVVPVIVRPVDWHLAPFGRLQALPRDGKPVTLWKNRDSAWLNVAEGIRAVVEDLSASP